MMKLQCLLTVYFLFSSLMICAQDDSLHYIHGLPHMDEDSSMQSGAPDVAPFDKHVSVSVEQLPPAIVKTLNSGDQYNGWENASMSLDKNTKLYWLHFTTDSLRRSYGFHKDGSPVRVEEKVDVD
ncbi:MAG TPA: hypothetical protein VD884_15670 [Ohtaekwangia sp.]|nr:hypothetical protein [Ohtaekwangia sp.]